MVDSGTQFHPRRRFFKTCSDLPAPRSFGKRNSEAAIRCWQQPVNHGEAPGGHIVRPALLCFDPAFPRNERPIPYDGLGSSVIEAKNCKLLTSGICGSNKDQIDAQIFRESERSKKHWEITMPPINTSNPTMTFFRILT